MLTIQNKIRNERKEECHDPCVGKRVICLEMLPTITLLGTIQHTIRYANGVEYWHVLTDGPMTEEAPASHFRLYEGPEFQAGEQVKYRLDAGDSWQATVLRPVWTFDHLRFLIRVDRAEHATVTVRRGHIFAAHPGRLGKSQKKGERNTSP